MPEGSIHEGLGPNASSANVEEVPQYRGPSPRYTGNWVVTQTHQYFSNSARRLHCVPSPDAGPAQCSVSALIVMNGRRFGSER